MSIAQEYSPIGIKQVPQDKSERDAIRRGASEASADLDQSRPPEWSVLQSRARAVLDQLKLDYCFLGYAMVAVSNAFWRKQFETVPMDRRLLLLPHCLSDKNACTGHYDSVGLHCRVCGSCDIGSLKQMAEKLGYHVITAEGTTSVIMKVLEGNTDAVLGVACLDSLEKSYSQIVEFGIPQVAVPLVADGCTDTQAEIEEIISILHAQSDATKVVQTRSYLPLYRENARIFDDYSLAHLLEQYVTPSGTGDATSATGDIALDWLKLGGKRLRPFITVAAYAVGKHGLDVLKPDADVTELLPDSVKRLALAIEALHKASLVHDDIEDDDEFRYGRRTIHREHGVAPAINIGDYLVGLGYRLIAGETAELGAQCAVDILSHLSAAHLDLCRGQGAELLWQDRESEPLKPIDALSIYALKTAPAFEVALYAGLRAADVEIDGETLRRFCTYVGEGYQVLNDLEEWQQDGGSHSAKGNDALAERPALLRAFAIEAGGESALNALLLQPADNQIVERLRELYTELGVFDKAERLLERLRSRALDLADELENAALRELMSFLVKVILPHRSAA